MTNHELVVLVSITQHNIALLFSNYLLTLNIRSDVKLSERGYDVYCQHDKLDEAKDEFEVFIKQPFNPKYQQAAWEHGEISDLEDNSPTFGSVVKRQFLAHAGIATLVIFALCWLVYILSIIGFSRQAFELLHFFPQLSLSLLFSEPWRLLGPAFFHFSLLHIAFNTMWWWQLGGSIEKTLGKGALINLFLVSAIVSNIGQFIVSGPNFGGLSGVVYALVGFVWWAGWLAPQKGLQLSKPIIGFLLVWLMLGFVDLLPVNVANTAHLLGLLSGCLLALIRFKLIKKS